MQDDPDPETRAELARLIEARSDELADRFAGPLAFGTAGLRGVVGAGESRMNRAVVRRAAAGLARYLTEEAPEAARRGVVVGYDARRGSLSFAEETARVLAAGGLRVHLSAGVCPTPIVAYAVRALGAAAGVMVTASHNPPEYNGYKVYADNGAQIVPPADERIATGIAQAGPANAIATVELGEAEARGLCTRFGDEIDGAYLDAVARACPTVAGDRALRIVYTPLHGVGARLLTRLFRAQGFTGLDLVAAQAEPDAAFSTVRFPNPEEPGTMDLALARAREIDAGVVLANDPDADRLAAGVRTGPGAYAMLTGNEIGVLLGDWLIEHALAEGGAQPLVVASIVSTPLFGALARAHGAAFAETLTGFKWIATRAMALERSLGARFVFGFEEALGYAVGAVVRDKDGIGAALALATRAAELAARGETLLDALERIYRRHGLYASAQHTLPFSGPTGQARMAELMATLRAHPPLVLAGVAVRAVVDCLHGVRREGETETALELPASDVLGFELEGGHRVLARPSGTEPKMKIYLDVREPLASGEPLAAARGRAAGRANALARAMLAHLGV
jgi:phosphomannomutase